MRDKREEAIAWVRALKGQTKDTDLRNAYWFDFISPNRIETFKREPWIARCAMEEGAIQILIKIFNIQDDEVKKEAFVSHGEEVRQAVYRH